MRQSLIIGIALAIAVASTVACCFPHMSPSMASMASMPSDSGHDHFQGPADATGDDPLLPCCSPATDSLAILVAGSTNPTFDAVTTASLPRVDPLSPVVQIHGSWSDIHQLPPVRHGLLHDISILRI